MYSKSDCYVPLIPSAQSPPGQASPVSHVGINKSAAAQSEVSHQSCPANVNGILRLVKYTSSDYTDRTAGQSGKNFIKEVGKFYKFLQIFTNLAISTAISFPTPRKYFVTTQ